jgi:serine phosphatase RsbU (regulator of sigma subunit)
VTSEAGWHGNRKSKIENRKLAMTTKANNPSLLDWGVASLSFPGEPVCGDLYLVEPFPNGVLVAAVDGVGHGAEAAAAAQLAAATLRAYAHESVLSLLKRCHEALRETRGVVLTVASFNALDATMTWVGVGNVEGVLLRAEGQAGPLREYVLSHGGVLGHQLPPLRGFVLSVVPGDTLLIATDGIRSGFAEGLNLEKSPQEIADRILDRDTKGSDDALVLVARYQGGER